MDQVQPWIGDKVRTLRPDFKAISVVAKGFENCVQHFAATDLLDAACADLQWAPWAERHLESWREAFRSFGAQPKKTPSSSEGLRARVAKGGDLPSVSAVVDLYNAISVKFALPVGGEDLDAYIGQPRLVVAEGGEIFETAREGVATLEGVPCGEVVWRDDLGVTCRRWNWRQGRRTRIELDSTNLWFVLEALGTMPDDAFEQAAVVLCENLLVVAPSATVGWTRIP